jgi:hypothetical protein
MGYRYDECRLFIVMPSGIMLSVVMLNVVVLSVVAPVRLFTYIQ